MRNGALLVTRVQAQPAQSARRARFLRVGAAVLLLAGAVAPAAAQAPDRLVGRWNGALTMTGADLQVQVRFTADGGILAGTISIPQQGAQDLPLSGVTLAGDSVVFTIAGAPGEPTFRGVLAGDTMTGTFRQTGISATFRLVRGAAAAAAVRRDYSAPLGAPYTAENVTVTTPMGHTLAGTLTLPHGACADRRVAAVVTITGSGPQDRDERLDSPPGFRPFRQLADSLGRRGIAVLRMDDRGTGESTGNHATATSADFAEDIRAGLAWLRTRPEIDAARLGLVGHSEGGLIGPLVAAAEPALGALVLMAGPAEPGRPILEFQMSNLIRQDPSLSPAARDSALAAVTMRIDSLKANNPWMGFFIDHDPLLIAPRVRAPVLILNGGTDQQVKPEHAAALARAFESGGNRDVTVHVFPDVNHLFIYDPDGFPGGYARLTRSAVEPAVMGMVVEWLVARLGNRR